MQLQFSSFTKISPKYGRKKSFVFELIEMMQALHWVRDGGNSNTQLL